MRGRVLLLVLAAFAVVLALGYAANQATPDLGVIQEPSYVPAPAGSSDLTLIEPQTTVEPQDEDVRATVTAVRVIDGDTIETEDHGSRRDVRILGIDTPETKHPTKGVQCFGPQATAETKALLPARSKVVLTFEGERTDRFGRLLAYVRNAEGVDVSAHLAGNGFAHVYGLRSPYRVQRTPELLTLEAQARQRRLGLWGACP